MKKIMRSHGNIFIKLIVLLLVAIISFAIYWLWQRQPKPQVQSDETASTQSASLEKSAEEPIQITSPPDHSVIPSNNITLRGKTDPDSYVVIYSGSANTTVKSDTNGIFEKEIAIGNQLNLIGIAALDNSLKTKFQKTLTYYQSTDSKNSVVYAGEVKSIFDTVITVTSQEEEVGIRTNKSTSITLPSFQNGKTEEGVKGIRIQDYAIVLGQKNKDVVTARSVQIVRENKPQNTQEFTPTTFLSTPKQNSFMAQTPDDKTLEFTLNTSSEISLDGKGAQESDIIKEKNAIIIFHSPSGTNIVDSIYLLP